MLACKVARWVKCRILNYQLTQAPFKNILSTEWKQLVSPPSLLKKNSICANFFLYLGTAAVLIHLSCVTVALGSNCHLHCFVLMQHFCVTLALSNNHHCHFILMQFCCVTVALISTSPFLLVGNVTVIQKLLPYIQCLSY